MTRFCAGALALLMLLPGIPSIYYSQEVGVTGEKQPWNYDADGIPMREAFPWSADVDAPGMAAFYKDSGEAWDVSFYRGGAAAEFALPAQQADPDSIWNHYRELIALRKQHVAFRRGNYAAVDAGDPRLMAFTRATEDQALLIVLNLSDDPVSIGPELRAEWRSAPLAGAMDIAPWDYTVLEAQ